mgnify:CR=1 FL=1
MLVRPVEVMITRPAFERLFSTGSTDPSRSMKLPDWQASMTNVTSSTPVAVSSARSQVSNDFGETGPLLQPLAQNFSVKPWSIM